MVLSKTSNGYYYNRSHSEFVDKLATKLCARYNAINCVISPSGMCAISTVLNCLPKEKLNIIYGSELYVDTPRLIKFVAEMRENVSLFEIDVTDDASLLKLFGNLRNNINVLFTESCSNPNGYMLNPDIIPKLRKLSSNMIYIVDNTWLTSAIYNPFEHYADYVVTSLTKYYSCGTAMGGAILTNRNIENIMRWISIHGLHVSPYNAKLILENIDSVDIRIEASSDMTLKIIDTLKNSVKISHPSLKDHPSNKLTRIYFKYYPSVFTFGIKASNNKVSKAIANSKIIEHKTSFGNEKSRLNPWTSKQDDFVMCRISIGYNDDYDTILLGINEILQAVTK